MPITRATSLAGLGTVFDGTELRIGSSVDTGTANQLLQVTGGAYVSESVAIGRTNALSSSKLHVLGGVLLQGGTRNTETTLSYGGLWAYFDSVANTYHLTAINASNSELALSTKPDSSTATQERLRISSTGNVGIGTSTNIVGQLQVANGPVIIGSATSTGTTLQPLQVSGGAYISNYIAIGATVLSTTNYVLQGVGTTSALYNPNSTNAGAPLVYFKNNDVTAGTDATIRLDANGSTTTAATTISAISESTGGNSALAFGTRSGGGQITEKVRITSTGAVGIGTTNPGDKFHLQGIFRIDRGLSAQDQGYVRFFRQGTEKARFGLVSSDNAIFINGTNSDVVNHLVINSSGNIGLGTGSPTSFYGSGKSLTIFGNAVSSTLSIQAWDDVNNRDTQIELLASGNGSSTNTIVFGDTDATPFTPSPLIIKAYSSGVSTERARIASSGRIGINTNIHTYANAITRVAILGFNGTAANNAGIQEVALGIAGSMRVGSALNVSTFAQPYFTNAGIDIMVGSGTRALNVWSDDSLQYPFFTVERTGKVGIGSTSLNGHWLKVVGDDPDPAALFIRNRVDSTAIIQCVNRSGSVVFQPNCDGNVSVPIGNLVIGTAGKGIDFSQDANNAGMDSELLDDYEQGSFTIGISGPGGPTVTSQLCRYVKVGNVVTINISALVRQNTASGTQTITGLPFSARNTSGYTSIGVGYWSNTTINIVTLLCRITANSSNLSVWRSTAAASTLTQWQGSDWQSASDTTWDFTLTYLTD